MDSTNFESYQRLRERSSPSWLESIQVYWLDPRWWMSVGHPPQAEYLLLHACYPFVLVQLLSLASRPHHYVSGYSGGLAERAEWLWHGPMVLIGHLSRHLWYYHFWMACLWPLHIDSYNVRLCLHLRQRFVELLCETLWRPRQLKHTFPFLTIFQRYWRAVIISQLVGKWGPVNTGRFLLSLKCAVFRGTWCASGPSVEKGSDCGLYLAVWWVTWRVDLQSSFKDPNLL